MDDFQKIVQDDVVITFVNLSRATIKEAGELKNILTVDIENGYRKLVVDISHCEFIDSTFLGALVFTLKQISKVGGDIRIVKSERLAGPFMKKLGTLKIFNISNSVEAAIESYNSAEIFNHYLGKSYMVQL